MQRNATPCKRFLKLFSKPLVFKGFQHVETGLPGRVIPGCQRATLETARRCDAAPWPIAAPARPLQTPQRLDAAPCNPARRCDLEQTPLAPLRHSDRASQYHPPPVQQRSGIVRTLLITWPTANPDRLVNVSVWPDDYMSLILNISRRHCENPSHIRLCRYLHMAVRRSEHTRPGKPGLINRSPRPQSSPEHPSGVSSSRVHQHPCRPVLRRS